MVPSVHPDADPSAEARWVGAGSVAGSRPEGSQRRQSAALFFTGLPWSVLPTPRPLPAHTGDAACQGSGPALGRPAALAPISRSAGPSDLPGGYTLENSQVSPQKA